VLLGEQHRDAFFSRGAVFSRGSTAAIRLRAAVKQKLEGDDSNSWFVEDRCAARRAERFGPIAAQRLTRFEGRHLTRAQTGKIWPQSAVSKSVISEAAAMLQSIC